MAATEALIADVATIVAALTITAIIVAGSITAISGSTGCNYC